MPFRSLLFVPGARPDRFDKALASGADAVCIDLEDAVAPDNKPAARRETIAFVRSSPQGAALGLRINALTDAEGFRDAVALVESGAAPAFVMIPKVASAFEIAQLRSVLGPKPPPIWALMETPEAFFALPDIARTIGNGGGIMFGGADYSASLGAALEFDAMLHARSAIAAAAALAGCATMDVPFLDVKDDVGMRAETKRVKALGFQGRAAIHPTQIAAINEIFTPSADDISKSERVAAASEAAAGGVVLLDGKLIEKPVLRAAERVLALKGR